MTIADQAARAGHDGQVSRKPGKATRRTFTAAYKTRILAEFDALPEGSERGALLRSERLYHSHIEHWRKQQEKGTLAATTGQTGRKTPGAPAKDTTESDELKRLRAENAKLKTDSARLEKQNTKLSGELGKTKTALEVAGKVFALLENISSSADSDEK